MEITKQTQIMLFNLRAISDKWEKGLHQESADNLLIAIGQPAFADAVEIMTDRQIRILGEIVSYGDSHST